MQTSGYQPQNRLYHYKSYCRYFLLYEAVMGCTKELNEVTKSLKSHSPSSCCWKAAKRHCNSCGLQQGLRLPCHQCCYFERPSSMWEIEEDHPTRCKTACRIVKTNRFSSVTQLSQKWSCALGREVSTATTFGRLREMGFRHFAF